MSDFNEARAEELVEARLWNRSLSPTIQRLMRMNEAELANVETPEEELARREARRKDCTCYPLGFISWSKEIKAEQKRLHIEAGRHAMTCPMWVDKSPLYSREGDAPSYTVRQSRQDAEAEAVDYSRGPGRFRWND